MLACGGSGASGADAAADARTQPCSASIDCDDGLFCNGEERCVDGECLLGSPVLCEDGVACTRDRCDEARRACVNAAPDEDGDGHTALDCGGDDCDDADAHRFPGNTEVCDTRDDDEDCDPESFGERDADGDGSLDARCCNLAADGSRICGDDCDDAHPSVHPGEAEDCDGLDNDCNGEVDDGVTQPFWPDADADGEGDATALASDVVWACHRPASTSPFHADCDDTNAAISPSLPEVCDEAGVDEDCDGVANPADRCACSGTSSRPCPLSGACAAGVERCISGAYSACTVAAVPETCNGVDDDCDGLVDDLGGVEFGLRLDCFVDRDNDGFAAPDADHVSSCPAAGRSSFGGCPSGTTNRDPSATEADCDDTQNTIRPGAPERANGVDDDCDGMIDEGT